MNFVLLILIAFCFQSSSSLGHELNINWTETEQYEVLQMPGKRQEKQSKEQVSIKIEQETIRSFVQLSVVKRLDTYIAPIDFLPYARYLRHCSFLN